MMLSGKAVALLTSLAVAVAHDPIMDSDAEVLGNHSMADSDDFGNYSMGPCLEEFLAILSDCPGDMMCKEGCRNFVARLTPFCSKGDTYEAGGMTHTILDQAKQADDFCDPCMQEYMDLAQRRPECLCLNASGCWAEHSKFNTTCKESNATYDMFGDGHPVRVRDVLAWNKFCGAPTITPLWPHASELHVSGFHCPNGYGQRANGRYMLKGHTWDGLPYFVNDQLDGSPPMWFYYAKECSDGHYPAWLITKVGPHEYRQPGQGCDNDANIWMEPMHPGGRPELPLGTREWSHVWCGDGPGAWRTITVDAATPGSHGGGRCIQIPYDKAMRINARPCVDSHL